MNDYKESRQKYESIRERRKRNRRPSSSSRDSYKKRESKRKRHSSRSISPPKIRNFYQCSRKVSPSF